MKFYLLAFFVLGVALAQNSESNADDLWSWISGPKQGENGENKQTQQKSVDEVVDSILQNGRQGRNLQGYDEIYSDPAVQQAIQNGNDTTARHYIKDRLCNLGLMQVEGRSLYGLSYLFPRTAIELTKPLLFLTVRGRRSCSKRFSPPQWCHLCSTGRRQASRTPNSSCPR